MDWQQHLVQARGRWQSYDLHASLGAESPVELLQHIQQVVRDTGVFLATADVVVLTLGTAWTYRLKETGELVSNCHKLPADKFEKELLTPDEIINAVAETHAYLRLRNPKLRFVLTVSPVRHVKDTLPLNSVSKSVLRVACHYLSELLPDVSYFPAYELLLDDLRDYRFYAEDMLHPSKVAEDYIWERFARTYFDAGFGRFRKEWEAVRQALNHRPLYLAAPEYRQFLESTLEKLERLSGQADVRMELLDVRRRLESLPLPKEPEPEPEDDEERIDIGEFSTVTLPRSGIAAVAPEPVEEAEEFETFESVSAPTSATEYQEDEQDEDAAEAETAEILGEVAPAKKRRRSRGGAKRNKKKHAARLAAEAAELASGEAVSVAIPPADASPEAPTVPLPPAPAVVITADAEQPLQTALERRKRNSRRGGRGRRDADASIEPAGTASPEENRQPESSAPAQAPLAPMPAPTVETGLEDTASASATEASGTRRPERTGRSASEKRAAAIRKPHRSSSRFKSLYNEDAPAAAEAPVETMPAEPLLPAADTTAVAASEPAATPAPAASASAIPDTKGTGASGQLSANGKATRSDRPKRGGAKPAPVEAAETASATETAEAPAANAPVAPAEDPPKTVRKPRRAAPKPLVSQTPPPEAVAPAAPESGAEAAPATDTAARPARKSRAKHKAAESTAAAAEEAAPKAPAKSRRKPAATSAAEPTEPAVPAAAPAKRPRPPRRKPAAPDTPPENA
ncbi:GSCFA family protein [Hymenobacter psychrotolerans DSM 18569]|uniref:GSCFA family protein n=2 Tax=Hymenobacter psychrotolerans TaxID=344998 RepID=A0A1M6U041_9BACT|nr:GSCFA family protein [Hymenobacter psychrotolerans DSM 18569]